MDTAQAVAMARSMVEAYPLPARFVVEVDRAKARAGLCKYPSQTRPWGIISLSAHFIANNDSEAVRQTVLHEIAHALVGPNHGHGYAWRRTLVSIGGNPQRVNTTAKMPARERSFALVCIDCDETLVTVNQHRRPTRYTENSKSRSRHRGCGGFLRWIEG